MHYSHSRAEDAPHSFIIQVNDTGEHLMSDFWLQITYFICLGCVKTKDLKPKDCHSVLNCMRGRCAVLHRESTVKRFMVATKQL